MRTALKLKLLLVFILALLALVLLMPTFRPDLPSWFTQYVFRGQLKLGLDLKGGVHLVLQPDGEKALKNRLERLLQDLNQALVKKEIKVEIQREEKEGKVKFLNPKDFEIFKKEILPEFKELSIKAEKREDTLIVVTLNLSKEYENFLKDHLLDQLMEVLRNRIDQFGVTEPIITKQGKDKVVVQLPGVKDPERSLKIIGQTAQLEFKLVDEDLMKRLDLNTLLASVKDKVKDPNNLEEWRNLLNPYLPPDREFYFEIQRDRETGNILRIPLLLKKETLLTGEYIKNARVQIDPTFNEPYVWIQFNERGAKIFEAITSANVGRRLAIILDGVVRSAPEIKEKISGGSAQITGAFTMEEAKDLALVLRAGALPAPVKILQNITIGPSLGRDSIEKGIKAGLIGSALVILFVIIYYKVSGLIAVIALLFNIYFLLALLSAFQATLTLPGIAGIILSIGMGVDSNVLIFERIREELKIGRTSFSAIFEGYSKTFWTIFDAHITVLLTSLILFLFGTGPIKGFAVTLSLSILINLFTAIFLTKIFYEVLYAKGKDIKISFLSILENSNFPFMSYKKFFIPLSGILTIIGLGAFGLTLWGKANLGIDFTGGTISYIKTDKPPDLNKIRSILNEAGFKDFTLQDVKGENLILVKLKSKKDSQGEENKLLFQTLNSKVAEYKFYLLGKEEIGGVISKELKNKAFFAILASLLGIILYLSFRFNFYFGLAAGITTFHDVVAVFALFYLLNLEINLLFITALLTIAGYSLTDTVVIFDRIREVILKGEKHLDFDSLINKALNEVLPRTLITTITTLFGALALLFFGGITLRNFALALTLGFILGTYSSVFIASPLLKFFHKRKIPDLKSKEEFL